MPLMSMMAAQGFGRASYATSDPAIVSGNATTNMNTTGFTQLSAVAGVDDNFAYIPTDVSFNFFFFGTDYGKNNVSSGIYWNTNNVIGFGAGVSTPITWAANTGRGVLIGNTDRRTNTFWYSPMTTSGTSKITQFLLFFQNIYNDGVTNAGQYRVRLIRSSTKQYIEVRIFKGSGGANSGTIATTGQWNITNGTAFQGTYGSTFNSTFPADNTSFVLSSDINGNNWTFTNTAYVNI